MFASSSTAGATPSLTAVSVAVVLVAAVSALEVSGLVSLFMPSPFTISSLAAERVVGCADESVVDVPELSSVATTADSLLSG